MIESSPFPIDKSAFLRSCAFASHYRAPKAASSTIKMFLFDETLEGTYPTAFKCLLSLAGNWEGYTMLSLSGDFPVMSNNEERRMLDRKGCGLQQQEIDCAHCSSSSPLTCA
jgi:hypothetical protein